MKKVMLAFFLSGSLVVSGLFSSTTLASEGSSTGEVDKTLLDFGFDQEVLEYIPIEKKIEIASTIKENPEKVSVSSNITNIDNIEIIERYVNTSDETLIAEGFTTDEVNEIRGKLDILKTASDRDLQNKFNLTSGEVKLLKNALKEKAHYKTPVNFGENEVTTSGQIATSKLQFTMSVLDYSKSNAPEYRVTLNHTWKSPYFFDIVSDNVAAAWGGGLDTKNIGSLVYYVFASWYTQSYGDPWGSVAARSEVTPNTGIVYIFEQNKEDGSKLAQAKSGTYWFTAFQTKKAGKSTTIVSQYAHKVGTITNVSISKTPSIEIGLLKDVSEQEKYNITY